MEAVIFYTMAKDTISFLMGLQISVIFLYLDPYNVIIRKYLCLLLLISPIYSVIFRIFLFIRHEHYVS